MGGLNKGFIEVSGVTAKTAEKTLKSTTVTAEPTETVYVEGEAFDDTSMVVIAAYTDGSEGAVTGYTASPSGVLTVKDASVTVAYTKGSTAKTVVQAITTSRARDFGGTSGGSDGSGSGSGGSGGGSGSGSDGSGGGSSGSGGGSGHLAFSGGGLKVSLPKDYIDGMKITNNVKAPSYVEKVIQKAMEGGRWRLGRTDGSKHVNTWVAAYNPCADLSIGQQAFDWFLFDGEGFTVTDWYTDGTGNAYYLSPVSDNTKGRTVADWNVIDGRSCYSNEESNGIRGKLYQSTVTPDGYHVSASGVWDGRGRQG